MRPRNLYMPCSANPEMMFDAVRSVLDQVDSIEVINNTMVPFDWPDDLKESGKVKEMMPPDSLLYGQSLNYAVRDSDKKGLPYCFWAHCDILVKPGAVDLLFAEYERIKDTKWGVVWTNYDTLCLFNPRFFIDEDRWDDSYLFAQYFGDNHRGRFMQLLGYAGYVCAEAGNLVTHIGSHSIKNLSFQRKNDVMFPHCAKIYSDLWGGGPGQETNTDVTLGGMYSRH